MVESTSRLFFVVIVASVTRADVIQTSTGPVQGIVIPNAMGKSITLFSGIPYAEPPIGQLRFKPPIPVRPWTDVIITSNEKTKICMQQVPVGFETLMKEFVNRTSEDCLTLNIWINHPHKAPVIVYIHGGGYYFGYSMSPKIFHSTIVHEENVILVSMNYRLNVFGFLGLGIQEAPGNVGLMDQNLALKWIRENIHAFGGDPDSITVMGMSAGSMSVGIHLLATKSKGLFQRAILMSGVPNALLHREPEFIMAKARNLAKSLACDMSNNSAILDCLLEVPAQELVDKESSLTSSLYDFFRPTVDGHFVKEDPTVSLLAGRFNAVPILIGTTSKEGGFLAMRHKQEFTDEEGALNDNSFHKILGKLFESDPDSAKVKSVSAFYKNWTVPDDPYMMRDAAVNVMGDYFFSCGANSYSKRFFEAGGTVYRYLYDQKDPTSKEWLTPAHASDLGIVFGVPLGQEGQPQQEVHFSRKLMKHWANFARTGDPNIPGSPVQWPKYDVIHRRHMRLAYDFTVGSQFRVQECAFLDHLLPSISGSGNC